MFAFQYGKLRALHHIDVLVGIVCNKAWRGALML